MKKLSVMLCMTLLTFAEHSAYAKRLKKPMSKQQRAELKAWKKRKAVMSPSQFKQLIEETHNLKAQYKCLVQEAEVTQEALEAEIAMLTMQAAQKEKRQDQREETRETDMQGVVFKVQIGAYKKCDLGDILEKGNLKTILEQEQIGELNAYTLGKFRDYWQANQFKKALRAMGLKDAWVVILRDGKRVPFKEVWPEIVQKNNSK